MSDLLRQEDRERRHEVRLLFISAAAYVLVAGALELATLAARPAGGRLALAGALIALIAGRYLGWSRLPFAADKRTDYPYLLAGIVLVCALALTLDDRVALFFYMLSFEGCSVFIDRRQALAWTGFLVALSAAVSVAVRGGLPDGQGIVQDLLVYALNLVATELIIRQEAQRTRVEGLLAELDQAYRRLQGYTAQAESLAVAQERNRLAREIHDTLGHTLTALDVQLALLGRLPEDAVEERHRTAEHAGRLVRDGLADLRRSVQALRPGALEAFSLPLALAALVDDVRSSTGLTINSAIDADVAPTSGVALVFYRATQEALTNVSRHARATHVTIALRRDPDATTLTVEDDGRGGEPHFGHGLRGLEERAAALGGTLAAGPAPDGGFRLTLVLPNAD